MDVTVKSIRTRRNIRSGYVRSGETITMDRIPNGRFDVEFIKGFNWSFSKTLGDGISKGGFLVNQETKRISKSLLYNKKMTDGFENCTIDGKIESENISVEDFLN